MKRICVNCGSNMGRRPEYMEEAVHLGKILAEKRIELVYGGASVGLMGALASSAMKNGGKVIGVIPESLADKVIHDDLSERHVVSTMHERKMKMFDLSDGFIAFPGGMGTLEEVFEILTWAQLGFHEKPCGLLNIYGYYDRLIGFLDHAVHERFMRKEHKAMILVDTKAEDLLLQFEKYQAPKIEKWIHEN